MTTAYTPVGANATATVPLPEDLAEVSAANDSPAWQRCADRHMATSHGIGTQAMADANQTPAASVYQAACIKTTGALTGTKTLTLPTLTALTARQWTIKNECTGGSVEVKCAAGTTVTIATVKAAIVFVDSTGVWRVTADLAY